MAINFSPACGNWALISLVCVCVCVRALSRHLHDRSEKRRRVEHPHHSTYGVPTSLNLRRKIFLSHSGRDKDFVCFLYEQLCRRYHDDVAFFDQETLPKAKAISMENILEEARGSKLGVLVLTEDFFMNTKNPMLELEAFVAGKVPLLPLFFKMSVEEFKEKSRRARWEKRWRKWVAVEQINEWRRALDHVKPFNGLEYVKIGAANHQQYIHKIVNAVTRITGPSIPFINIKKGVFGKDRLCKIVNDMYNDCVSKRSSNDRTQDASTSTSSGVGEDSDYTLDVVGIYGFAGLGKTTLCKCLCDFYFREFSGNAYYVDLASRPSCQASSQTHSSSLSSMRKQKLLSMLQGSNNNDTYSFQVEYLLQRQFSLMEDPIFLAIDNVLPKWESQEEADFYLRCKFPKGSKIFITARSKRILEVFSQHSCLSIVINYIPALELKEVRDIFLHAISDLFNFGTSNAEDEVDEIVNMCTIFVDYGLKYHPLMLESLIAYIKYGGIPKKGILTKLKLEGIADKTDALEKVFSVLGMTYEIMTEEEKTLFLDLVLYYHFIGDYYPWIHHVYSHLGKEKTDKIILKLQDLSLLVEGSLVPGVVVDFAKDKASQSNNYLVVEADKPAWPHYYSLRRCAYRNVSISRSCGMINGKVDLRDVEGVEVLHLVDNAGMQEVLLSRTTCRYLRSLIVRVPPGSSLRCTMDEDWSTSAADQGRRGDVNPTCVELQGNVIFTGCLGNPLASLADHLGNLQTLSLDDLPALQGIDLSAAIRLEDVTLCHLPSLSVIRGLDKSTNLRQLEVYNCEKLSVIRGLDKSTNIRQLDVSFCDKLRFIPGLDKLTNLELGISIAGCGELQELTIPGDSGSSISDCKSIRRISICPPTYDPESADCGIEFYLPPTLDITSCGSLSNIDGLSQYTGRLKASGGSEKICRELLESAGIDSSRCKATVKALKVNGNYLWRGLAAVEEIELEDAQHMGLVISAMFKMYSTLGSNYLSYLQHLSICCKRDGDCGCDKNGPHFGPLPQLRHALSYTYMIVPRLKFCCPQVRDLASIAQWHLLQRVELSGCKSVEVWPDFAIMTSLRHLDLSYTSLKEWPAGVQFLPHLEYLDIRGCGQLPAEEFIKVIIQQRTNYKWPPLAGTLIDDLEAARRDRCSVVDALDSHYQELIHLSRLHFTTEWLSLVNLLYELWFGELVDDWSRGSTQYSTLNKMRRLLCSEFFMSFSFVLCSGCAFDRFNRISGLNVVTKSCYISFGLMAVALVGVGSIGWYNASVNENLKAVIIAFVKWYFNHEELVESTQYYPKMKWEPHWFAFDSSDQDSRKMIGPWCMGQKSPEETKRFKVRVKHAVCKMARVPSVAAELGKDFIKDHVEALESADGFEEDYLTDYLVRRN